MRTYEEYRSILEQWELGCHKKTISRASGIPRATVRDCIDRFRDIQGLDAHWRQASPDGVLNRVLDSHNMVARTAYAYLLGLYLGDGEISRNRKIFRLRVALDKKYPGIIQSCRTAIQTLLPDNHIGIVDRPGCVYVSCYHRAWPQIFPQAGAGRKHQREIKLERWQQQIVDAYPLEFWCGLYHSDGSRFRNVVHGKDYPRYSFTNQSEDICKLFCDTCDRLGIHWTIKRRNTLRDHAIDIFISKRPDLAYLDGVVGPKT
ncbi:MAG: hypothetical protein K8J31_31815 [Anaerolineae bacterium]|nr:hypothetical protein [Anaerolineae bacterium]